MTSGQTRERSWPLSLPTLLGLMRAILLSLSHKVPTCTGMRYAVHRIGCRDGLKLKFLIFQNEFSIRSLKYYSSSVVRNSVPESDLGSKHLTRNRNRPIRIFNSGFTVPNLLGIQQSLLSYSVFDSRMTVPISGS